VRKQIYTDLHIYSQLIRTANYDGFTVKTRRLKTWLYLRHFTVMIQVCCEFLATVITD